VTDWREPPEIAEAHRSYRNLQRLPARRIFYQRKIVLGSTFFTLRRATRNSVRLSFKTNPNTAAHPPKLHSLDSRLLIYD